MTAPAHADPDPLGSGRQALTAEPACPLRGGAGRFLLPREKVPGGRMRGRSAGGPGWLWSEMVVSDDKGRKVGQVFQPDPMP